MVRDFYHQHVRTALEKEGWVITHDPLTIRGLNRNIHIDLAAERLVVAEKGSQKIAVEVKSFLGISHLTEFYAALGKYEIYLDALLDQYPDRVLFLAMPIGVFDELLKEPFIEKTITRLALKFIVFNPDNQIIEKWIA